MSQLSLLRYKIRPDYLTDEEVIESIKTALSYKRARQEKGISRQQLAEKLGITYTDVKKIECANVLLNSYEWLAWAATLELDDLPDSNELSLVDMQVLERAKKTYGVNIHS
jgi:ribosome-binding protein aMBF1 (putative translation factor)